MSNKKHRRVLALVSSAVSVLMIVVAGWLVLNRQYVIDQLNVWHYQPSTAVATISKNAGMSEKGQFYFYASHPAINTASEFNQNCARQEANSAILGCYSSGRIYIYDVPHTNLHGIEEVTAAHETLHAIWERMSEADKKSVGELLEQEYIKLHDTALFDRMAYYDRTEPGEHVNELHSILGTEYDNLGAKLEAHYKTYFSNRSKVVNLYKAYRSIFDSLKAQTDSLAQEMKVLKASIDANTVAYNNEYTALSATVAALKARQGTVDRTSASEVNRYNADRAAALNRIAALQRLEVKILQDIESYNVKVVAFNKLIVSASELSQSLDSTLPSAPSL